MAWATCIKCPPSKQKYTRFYELKLHFTDITLHLNKEFSDCSGVWVTRSWSIDSNWFETKATDCFEVGEAKKNKYSFPIDSHELPFQCIFFIFRFRVLSFRPTQTQIVIVENLIRNRADRIFKENSFFWWTRNRRRKAVLLLAKFSKIPKRVFALKCLVLCC